MKRAKFVALDPVVNAKNKVMEYIDSIFDKIYALINVPEKSLFQVISDIKSSGMKLDSKIVQIIIQEKLDFHFAAFRCPVCAGSLQEKYTRRREVLTTIGPISIDYPYFLCQFCKSYHSPYEEALNLRAGKYQYDVQKIAARMTAGETFEESAEMLNEIYGFNIASDTVHSLTNELAGEVKLSEIIPASGEVREIVSSLSEGQYRRPVFVFAADGAMAPIRTETPGAPHCWREVRGVRGYLLSSDHTAHVLSWHQIGSKADFITYLKEIRAKDIIPLDKVRLCFIADGAQWIWDSVQEVYPECREVLDYYHCSEHLHEFAKLHFGENKGHEWVEATKVRLFNNNAAYVIAGIKRMKCDDSDAEKHRDNLVNYLATHQHRIDYGRIRRGGYPIGSGAIESANKFISHIRLKRSGAWWKVNYANNILKLRCAKYNHKFDSFFADYEQARKAERCAQKLHKVK
jgi:hypothetical protein